MLNHMSDQLTTLFRIKLLSEIRPIVQVLKELSKKLPDYFPKVRLFESNAFKRPETWIIVVINAACSDINLVITKLSF